MIRPATGMKRVDFYLSKIQVEKIKKLSRATGLSASEIMRRAIDEYFQRQKEVTKI